MHDLDTPFMNLFYSNEYVDNYHKHHAFHHIEYSGDKDYVSMVIDWESHTLTTDCYDAIQRLNVFYYDHKDYDKILDVIITLGLFHV